MVLRVRVKPRGNHHWRSFEKSSATRLVISLVDHLYKTPDDVSSPLEARRTLSRRSTCQPAELKTFGACTLRFDAFLQLEHFLARPALHHGGLTHKHLSREAGEGRFFPAKLNHGSMQEIETGVVRHHTSESKPAG